MMQIRSIKGDNYKAYNKNSKIRLSDGTEKTNSSLAN
jgi:hypothetical protein